MTELKTCPFCQNGEHNKWFGNCGIESTMKIYVPTPWREEYVLSVASERIRLDYCPKCGRELNRMADNGTD